MDEDNNREHTNNLNNNNNPRNHNDRNGESQSRVDTSSNLRHQRPDVNSSRFRRHRYYSQYHINQFYDAAEDEQFYTDEYATLINTYGNFISNSNAMFARFESGLRGSITRSITRQYFYYNRYNQIVNDPSQQSSNIGGGTVPAEPVTNLAAESPVAPATNPATEPRRLARALLNAMNNEFNFRVPNNELPTDETRNTRLQPYAFFFDLTARDISGNNNLNNLFNRRETNIPTTQEIRTATINTRYSHIIQPTNSVCPISRDDFNDNSEVTQIRGCAHIFNRASLSEWFVTHSTCPMCRYDIRDYNSRQQPFPSQMPSMPQPQPPSQPPFQPQYNSHNRPDLATLNSIINNNNYNNTYDIYNRIIDNSANFMNTIINNMTDDEITFTYDIPPAFINRNRNIYRYNDDNDNPDNDNPDNDDIEEVD